MESGFELGPQDSCSKKIFIWFKSKPVSLAIYFRNSTSISDINKKNKKKDSRLKVKQRAKGFG